MINTWLKRLFLHQLKQEELNNKNKERKCSLFLCKKPLMYDTNYKKEEFRLYKNNIDMPGNGMFHEMQYKKIIKEQTAQSDTVLLNYRLFSKNNEVYSLIETQNKGESTINYILQERLRGNTPRQEHLITKYGIEDIPYDNQEEVGNIVFNYLEETYQKIDEGVRKEELSRFSKDIEPLVDIINEENLKNKTFESVYKDLNELIVEEKSKEIEQRIIDDLQFQYDMDR